MQIKRFLIIPALLFGLVSLTAVFIDLRLALIISAGLVLIFGLAGIFKSKRMWIGSLLFLLLSLSIAVNFYQINAVYRLSAEPIRITAEVTDIEPTDMGVNSIMRITGGELYGSKISVYSENALFGVGDDVDITVKPSAAENSYSLPDKIFSGGKIVSINSVKPSFLGSKLEKFRNSVSKKMFADMSNESASVFSALLIGDRDYLSPEIESAVKNAGLSHIIVVSGMHMAIIIGGLFTVLRKSRLPKWAVSLISVAATLLFMAICGFTPSVMRAGLMYLIIVFSGAVLRKNDAVTSLCAAAVIITVINPFIFGSVSFLLSASATVGVLVVYPKLSEKYTVKNKFLSAVWQAVLVSVSAVVCTAPVTLCFFKSVNIMSVITSVLVSLAVTGALVIGIFAVMISFVPQIDIISRFLFYITDILLKYFISAVRFFS